MHRKTPEPRKDQERPMRRGLPERLLRRAHLLVREGRSMLEALPQSCFWGRAW